MSSRLTALMGPNGSGKSNLVDALAFVRGALSVAPYHAIEVRGGLGEILRRVPTPTHSLRIELDLAVPLGPMPDQQAECCYGFEIERGSRPGQRPVEVVWETCELSWPGWAGRLPGRAGVCRGQFVRPSRTIPAAARRARPAVSRPGQRPTGAGNCGERLSSRRFYHFRCRVPRSGGSGCRSMARR